jgi:hypothetical protein
LSAGSGYLSQSEPLAFFGYAPGNPPDTVQVVWPDGSRTTHRWETASARLVLQKKP